MLIDIGTHCLAFAVAVNISLISYNIVINIGEMMVDIDIVIHLDSLVLVSSWIKFDELMKMCLRATRVA